jgi:poly [ADP-ribose] polymerase 10/14/15
MNFTLQYLDSQKITVISEVWDDFKGVIQHAMDPEDKLLVSFHEADSSCCIAGFKPAVSSKGDELNEIIKSLVEHEKAQQSCTDELKLSKKWQPLIFENLLPELLTKNPNVSISLDQKSSSVVFVGCYANIQKAKEDTQTLLSSVVRQVLTPCRKTTRTLLAEEAVGILIANEMKSTALVWDTSTPNGKHYWFYARALQDADEGIRVIRNLIKTHTLKIEGRLLNKVEKMLKSLLKKRKKYLAYNLKDRELEVSILAEFEDDLIEKLDKIVKNPLRKAKLSLDPKVSIIAQKNFTKSFQKIRRDYRDYDGDFEFTGSTEIALRCAQSKFEEFRQAFMDLLNRVQSDECTVQMPGIAKFLISQKGEDRLGAIEQRRQIAIAVQGTDGVESACSSFTISNCKVTVRCGDILRCKADVLVNAANEQLQHGGGLARAVVTEGPLPSTQEMLQNVRLLSFRWSGKEECTKFVKKKGVLKPGQVFVSKPGQLNFKHIVHAVGPRWAGGQQNEEQNLMLCVQRCLEKAKKRKARSIALPAVSSGIFGCPLEKVTRAIVQAIKTYDLKGLDEILLVDAKEEVADSFKKSLNEMLHGKSQPSGPQGRPTGSCELFYNTSHVLQ